MRLCSLSRGGPPEKAGSQTRIKKPVWHLFKTSTRRTCYNSFFRVSSFCSLYKAHTVIDLNIDTHTQTVFTSMVGSYSSTKWFWMSWMVSALLPTPPAPTTTSLYSVMIHLLDQKEETSTLFSHISTDSHMAAHPFIRGTIWVKPEVRLPITILSTRSIFGALHVAITSSVGSLCTQYWQTEKVLIYPHQFQWVACEAVCPEKCSLL